MNGLRFTDIPEHSVIRVFDAAGVFVWSAAEIQGQAFWDYQGIGARSGSSFAYLVEMAGPGFRSSSKLRQQGPSFRDMVVSGFGPSVREPEDPRH